MRLKLLLLNFLMLAAMMSCERAGNFENGMSYAPSYAVSESENAEAKLVSNSAVTIERKLIRNGRLELLTTDAAKLRVNIETLCKKYNAYVASESRDHYHQRLQFEQHIRIPAAEFDAFLGEAEALGNHTESRSISSEDVTEEFIDVEARLKTKKELEARYLSLLSQAKSVTDILAIESQVANTRAEIESMQGRLNYLKNQVSYSTLILVYYERTSGEFGFASRSFASLQNGWDNLLFFLLGLMNIWPFILAGIALVWLFVRVRRKKRIQKEASAL